MKSRCCITCLLACVVLCAGCASPPASSARLGWPLAVSDTPTPVLGKPWTVPDLGLKLVFVVEGSLRMGSEFRRRSLDSLGNVQIPEGLLRQYLLKELVHDLASDGTHGISLNATTMSLSVQ